MYWSSFDAATKIEMAIGAGLDIVEEEIRGGRRDHCAVLLDTG